jgi:hypothetical protein
MNQKSTSPGGWLRITAKSDGRDKREKGTDMLKAVKESVHRMASHLQLVSDEGNHKGTARAGDESNGVGERGDASAGGWCSRGSA